MRLFDNTNGIDYQLRQVINKYHKHISMNKSKNAGKGDELIRCPRDKHVN